MKRTRNRWLAAGAATFTGMALAVTGVGSAGASAPHGAAYTTFDATAGGCLDGSNGVDCNNYTGKDKVYMSGGPTAAGLSDGNYFFAVLVPGHQHDGFTDGSVGNLSDNVTPTGATAGDAASGDLVTNRTFTVTNHEISAYSGNHPHGTAPNGRDILQLALYDDTSNGGGVYILAVCESGATSPSQCKFDAFRIPVDNPPVVPPTADLTVSKTASASYDTAYTWSIDKSVTSTTPYNTTSAGVSHTFNYSITVTHSAGTDSGWELHGAITADNPNSFAVDVDVTDTPSYGGSAGPPISLGTDDPNADCSLGTTAGTYNDPNGSTYTVPAESGGTDGQKVVYYSCTFGANGPTSLTGTFNTATIDWDATTGTSGETLDLGSAPFSVAYSFTQGFTDLCTDVTDSFDGGTPVALANVCADGTSTPTGLSYDATTRTWTLTTTHDVTSPTTGCTTKRNTATETPQDTPADALSDYADATVCRVPPNTGALTIGFWQNKNGQGIINRADQSQLGNWLKAYHPFSNAPTTGVATYVYNIIKAATCTSTSKTCNSMLRAQMLATALNVYFSNTASGYGGNQIGAPVPIGGLTIDLQNVCKMIDGSGGTATCSGAYEDVSSAFGGAASMTVLNMLLYQNTADPAADAGAAWYGQVKATQVLAKDVFDAINNRVALIV
jgi:hypothetical protein